MSAVAQFVPVDDDRIGLARDIARAILAGFDKHYRLFQEAARRAKVNFERADWAAMRDLARERITMYDDRVEEGVDAVLKAFPQAARDERLWPAIKLAYISFLHDHKQPECAETFYNSVACQVLHRRYYRNEFIFWRPAVATEHLDGDLPTYTSYYPRPGTETAGLRSAFCAIATSFGLANQFEDLARDVRNLVHAVRARFSQPTRAAPDLQIQVLRSLFFRNKAAYVIGKAINGHREYPFAVPILQNAHKKIYLDTLLMEPEDLLILFSFARAYFFVDMEVPAAYVSFLRTIIPKKPRAEIYISVGLAKQGKTLFYRDLHYHLNHSTDVFVPAPGIKGMVMLVFTLPSFPYVFKIIRDRFAPPKETDRNTVKQKYLLVKLHDRVGRMADTLEYSLVALPRHRFAPELLDELRANAGSSVEFDGDLVVIKHMYIERRMTPLNLYLEEGARDGDDERVRHALRDYGAALKELAGANIFPGDLWFKNFGVTRYNRVVFYDYDEIDYLTNCNFRRIPQPRNDDEELSAEPWYTVERNDVFPEEFGRFLFADEKLRGEFVRYHDDLLGPDYWASIQERVRAGHVEDVFPYPEERRFCNAGGRAPGPHNQSWLPDLGGIGGAQ